MTNKQKSGDNSISLQAGSDIVVNNTKSVPYIPSKKSQNNLWGRFLVNCLMIQKSK